MHGRNICACRFVVKCPNRHHNRWNIWIHPTVNNTVTLTTSVRLSRSRFCCCCKVARVLGSCVCGLWTRECGFVRAEMYVCMYIYDVRWRCMWVVLWVVAEKKRLRRGTHTRDLNAPSGAVGLNRKEQGVPCMTSRRRARRPVSRRRCRRRRRRRRSNRVCRSGPSMSCSPSRLVLYCANACTSYWIQPKTSTRARANLV